MQAGRTLRPALVVVMEEGLVVVAWWMRAWGWVSAQPLSLERWALAAMDRPAQARGRGGARESRHQLAG